MRAHKTAALALMLAVAATAVAVLRAHDPITTKVTWSREIVRIVNNRCAGCHTKDGAGLFPLTTYEETKAWAKAIKEEVVSRRMPPWPAARGFGEFTNDPTLSPFEINLVAAWVDGGAPKGEAKDLPIATSSIGGSLAHPDVVLKFPIREAAPSGERRTVTVPLPQNHARWLLGWEFVPNDPAIVSAEFALDESNEPIDGWTPPDRAVWFPSGSGQPIARTQNVLATLVYRTRQQQQDFPADLPREPPELRFVTSNAAPKQMVMHHERPCGDGTGLTGLVFSARVTGALAGATIGVSGAWISGPTPVLWIPSFTPSDAPTYRFSRPIPTGSGLLTQNRGGGSDCRILASYLLPISGR